MLLAMARDIRVILIKLADRTHNMRTLAHLPPEKQGEIAQETLDIYAPLAHRLGIYWIKSELEDNALRYLHPEVYYQLKRNVAKKKAERERYIREVIARAAAQARPRRASTAPRCIGRPKHFYSIYQKMQAQNLLYEQIYDLIAFRIVVDSVSECYEALGVVHASWRPVPGRFKDYIALPKPNIYQSLHTTVIGPYGERIEIQIRTREMHRVAEYGIAAHWNYKAPGTEGAAGHRPALRLAAPAARVAAAPLRTPTSSSTVKEDLFSDEVFVFTPKGDLLNFPVGSTVIDFAYRIHSEVGRHCAGARVNGKLVPLRYQLQSGDTVEIITTANQAPSKDWLKLVKTSRAKARIRAYIKGQQSQRSVAVGREILERDLARHHLDLAKLRKDGTLERVLKELEVSDEEALLADVGYGKLTGAAGARARSSPRRSSSGGASRRRARSSGSCGWSAASRRAACACRASRTCWCASASAASRCRASASPASSRAAAASPCTRRTVRRCWRPIPQRRVDVQWENGKRHAARRSRIEVTCVDRPGLLAAMSKAISSTGINIARAQVHAHGRPQGAEHLRADGGEHGRAEPR